MVANATGAHLLAAALQRHGVDRVFGQSIPSAFFLVAPEFGIRQVTYRTENAGGAMADGYARASNRVAIVAAQNGPAATLLVAPLMEALKVSVPIVALVQDVARSNRDRNAFQEVDHVALFQSCAKWVRRVDDSARLTDYVDQAFAAAAGGRPGPAVLLLPADMLRDAVGVADTRSAKLGTFPLDRTAPDPTRVEAAVGLLARAERPLIVAGGGVHLSGASAELVALSERAGIPVATTNMGKGAMDETLPLSAGPFGNCMGHGSLGHETGFLIREADVVLMVGTRSNQNGTDSWKLYPPTARYIHLDVDGVEIGRNYEALRLVCDAKLGLRALHDAMPAQSSVRAAWVQKTKERLTTARQNWRTTLSARLPRPAARLRPERIMEALDRLLIPNAIVVADASYSTNWVISYLTARRPGARFLTPRGMAGLGWGLPMALGAKVAHPDAQVVAVVGDGGFAHCWSELETAKRMGLAVTVILLNNGILGFQAHSENVTFGRHTDACPIGPVDHVAIAHACGCGGRQVSVDDDVEAALGEALAGGPYVLDCAVDPDAYPPITYFADGDPLAIPV